MPIMFNTILCESGLKLTDIRLIRHQDGRAAKGFTPYELWGDKPGNYTKVIVTWGCTAEAKYKAKEQDIEIWDFRSKILREISQMLEDKKNYFTDDTLRTLHLYSMAQRDSGRGID